MSDFGEPTLSNAPINVAGLPRLDESQFQHVSPKARTLDLTTTGLATAVVWIGVTVGAGLTLGLPWAILPSAGVLLIGLLALWLASLAYRYRGWQLREHDLSYRSGVLNRRTVTVPFTRVQHASVSDGPIERALGLATLRVFSAGGSSADLVVSGLSLDDAEQLKAQVLAAAGRSE